MNLVVLFVNIALSFFLIGVFTQLITVVIGVFTQLITVVIAVYDASIQAENINAGEVQV